MQTPMAKTAKERKKIKQQIPIQDEGSLQATTSTLARGRVIQVEEFVEARAFEINAMENALLHTTQFIGNKRVFQRVPRHMRRRAASYNVKRLPVRVRQRALQQMANDPPLKKKKRSRHGIRQSAVRMFRIFRKRQENKTWLETHLFHAKRFHMNVEYRYSLAIKSNSKSARAMYSFIKSQSVLHDASYTRIIELSANDQQKETLIKMLSLCMDSTIPGITSARFSSGNRMGGALLYEKQGWPFRSVCPIEFVWVANDKVWIFVHPSAFDQAFDVLSQLENVNCVAFDPVEVNHFQIFGPRAHDILSEALKVWENPDETNTANRVIVDSESQQEWERAKHTVHPNALPPGKMFGLVVKDPRLVMKNEMQTHIASANIRIGTAPKTAFWSKDTRAAISDVGPLSANWFVSNNTSETSIKPMLKRGEGNPMIKIPIVMMQRGFCCNRNMNSFSGGYSILIPKYWGPAFFSKLVFCGARVAGQYEMKQLEFENMMNIEKPSQPYTGCGASLLSDPVPGFPHSFAGSKAWREECIKNEQAEMDKLARKPPSKRGISMVGWYMKSTPVLLDELCGSSMHMVWSRSVLQLLLTSFQGMDARNNDKQAAFQSSLMKQSNPLKHQLISHLKSLFLPVRLMMNESGGVLKGKSRLFGVEKKDLDLYRPFTDTTQIVSTRQGLVMLPPANAPITNENSSLLDVFPPQEAILGYTLDGGFSLSQGKNAALACISLDKMIHMYAPQTWPLHVVGQSLGGRRGWIAILDFL